MKDNSEFYNSNLYNYSNKVKFKAETKFADKSLLVEFGQKLWILEFIPKMLNLIFIIDVYYDNILFWPELSSYICARRTR